MHAPGQRSSLGGGGDLPGDVWRPAQRKRGPGGDPERREARRRAGGVEQRSWPEVEEKGPVCNFQKFQGPLCKQAITFKLKLK